MPKTLRNALIGVGALAIAAFVYVQERTPPRVDLESPYDAVGHCAYSVNGKRLIGVISSFNSYGMFAIVPDAGGDVAHTYPDRIVVRECP